MFKTDKIIDVLAEMRKIVKSKFNLMTNFPKKIYDGN